MQAFHDYDITQRDEFRKIVSDAKILIKEKIQALMNKYPRPHPTTQN